MVSFGGVSRFAAFRSIRRAEKIALCKSKGWEHYDPYGHEYRLGGIARGVTGLLSLRHSMDGSIISKEESLSEAPSVEADEEPALIGNRGQSISDTIAEAEGTPFEALKEMFTGNKINTLLVFLPFAYLSHAHRWSDGSIFILNFLAMVPLASMLGVFTEELAAHTNDVIGGLINATFGNAVELVVAIQALLQLMNDRFEYFDLLTKFDAFGAGRSWIISWISHDQKLNQIAKSDQISLSQSQFGTERLRQVNVKIRMPLFKVRSPPIK